MGIIENAIKERLGKVRLEEKTEEVMMVTMSEDQEWDEESEENMTIKKVCEEYSGSVNIQKAHSMYKEGDIFQGSHGLYQENERIQESAQNWSKKARKNLF